MAKALLCDKAKSIIASVAVLYLERWLSFNNSTDKLPWSGCRPSTSEQPDNAFEVALVVSVFVETSFSSSSSPSAMTFASVCVRFSVSDFSLLGYWDGIQSEGSKRHWE